MMRNIKLTLSYDGTDFPAGSQPGLRTVQQTLEDAILSLTQDRPTTTASGRTDAGVHALGKWFISILPRNTLPRSSSGLSMRSYLATSAFSTSGTCPSRFTRPWTPFPSGIVT